MADYKEMYLTLFREAKKAIELLQEAQIIAEDIYLSSEDAKLHTSTSDLRIIITDSKN